MRPLTSFDRSVLDAVDRHVPLNAETIVAVVGARDFATKGALGRLRRRGLIEGDGGRGYVRTDGIQAPRRVTVAQAR